MSPAELQRLFDAYVLMQAQDDLSLDDEQYPSFLPRACFQDAPPPAQTERARIVQELRARAERARTRRGSRTGSRRSTICSGRPATSSSRAGDSLDEVLKPLQQARFRIFEEMMEQRKVDLLMRARQGARGAEPPRRPNRP